MWLRNDEKAWHIWCIVHGHTSTNLPSASFISIHNLNEPSNSAPGGMNCRLLSSVLAALEVSCTLHCCSWNAASPFQQWELQTFCCLVIVRLTLNLESCLWHQQLCLGDASVEGLVTQVSPAYLWVVWLRPSAHQGGWVVCVLTVGATP